MTSLDRATLGPEAGLSIAGWLTIIMPLKNTASPVARVP